MSETFGRYTVIRQLGRGAMGVVYLASDPMLNRQVAVKTVDLSVEEPGEREFLRDQLLRDARAAAVLKHPHIVAIYDVFEDAGRAYVVMEYIEGESLAQRLKANPMPDASAMLKVLSQMADALDYTHARGVIHRDIKPANVMIDNTGTTKIMDFGIARMSDSRTCTPTGMVMGTVEYMAPEQILGEPLDGRADQFALAVVAYQMMTGSTLFGPNTVATLTYKAVNEAPPLPSTRNGHLPRGVDVVLSKSLSKKPADRFATCRDFAVALETAFSDAPTAPLPAPTAQVVPIRSETTVAMPPPSAAVPAPSGGSKVPVIVAAIAVVLLGGALAAVIWKPWNRTEELPAAITTPVTPPGAPGGADQSAKSPATVTTPPMPAAQPQVASKSPADTTAAVPKQASDQPKPAPDAVPSRPEPPKVAPGSAASIPAPTAAEPAAEIEFPSLPRETRTKGGSSPYIQAMQRGQQQVRSNDFAGAVRSFSEALALRPDSAQAHFSKGTALQRTEQIDAAMLEFSEAQRLDPRMVAAYTQLGVCLETQRKYPQALVEFQRALELNPDAPMALFGRGNIYLRRMDFAAAKADYDRLLRINPRFAPAYQNRAIARQGTGDFAGAAADRRTEQSLRSGR